MVTVTHVFFQISKAAQKAESLFLWDLLFCPQPELLIHGAGQKNRSFGDKNVTSGGWMVKFITTITNILSQYSIIKAYM